MNQTRMLGVFVCSVFIFFASLSATHAKKLEHKGYLIKLKPVRSLASATRLLNALGAEVKSEIKELNVVVTAKNPYQTAGAAGIQQLDSTIEYIEPNYVVHAIEANHNNQEVVINREDTNLWGFKAINTEGAWAITKGNKNVVVAVSDTGIWAHPDLKDNIWVNAGETGIDSKGKDKSKNKVDDDGNGFVDDVNGWNFETNAKDSPATMLHYHGTHVAGTVGAVGGNKQGITGVAWNTSMISLKFLDREGSGTLEGGIKTVLYSANMGAKAVNCSWGGGGYSQTFYDAIEYAKNKGTLLVAAAGNEENDNDKNPAYPASYANENVIAVAALESDKNRLTYFSNWGFKSVHLAAPGIRIYSTFNPHHSQIYKYYYYDLTGTSMAAPHVTGTIALMYSANPKLNWKQVKDMLMSSVTRSSRLEGKIISAGYLNAAGAVRAAADAQ